MDQGIIDYIYYSKSTQDIKIHSHNCCQMVYLKKGEIKLTVGMKEYIAKASCIFFISNLENHAVQIESREYERYCVYINHQAGLFLTEDRTLFTILENRPAGFKHVLDVSDIEAEVQWIFEKLLVETENKPFSRQTENMLIMYLLIILYRYSPDMFQGANHTVSVVSEIQRYIGQNYMKDLTLTQLAKKYHLSKYYLSHLFKKTTGYAPIEYLNMYRLAIARNLLVESGLTVSEICRKTGFSDLSNFCRSFKKHFGCSPTVYRKKFK